MSELDPKTEQFSSTFPFQSQRSDENEVFNVNILYIFSVIYIYIYIIYPIAGNSSAFQ